MKKIIAISLMLMTSVVSAQEFTYKGVKISWEPNPASENVGWYIVEFFNGSTNGWRALDNTSANEYSIRFDALAQQESVTIRPGSNMCFRLIAAKSNPNMLSEPSEQSCIVWEEPTDGEPPDNSTPDGLSQPVAPALGLY